MRIKPLSHTFGGYKGIDSARGSVNGTPAGVWQDLKAVPARSSRRLPSSAEGLRLAAAHCGPRNDCDCPIEQFSIFREHGFRRSGLETDADPYSPGVTNLSCGQYGKEAVHRGPGHRKETTVRNRGDMAYGGRTPHGDASGPGRALGPEGSAVRNGRNRPHQRDQPAKFLATNSQLTSFQKPSTYFGRALR